MNDFLTMKFQEVGTDEHIATVEKLAGEIWNEYFPAIITQSQIDYMLSKYQSAAAIKEQLKCGTVYYLLYLQGLAVGYISLVPDSEHHQLQLSKIYLLKNARGRGYAADIFRFIHVFMQQQQLCRLWLTVNKYNSSAIAVYKKYGFIITNSVVMEIGNGFVMDDYRMERSVCD